MFLTQPPGVDVAISPVTKCMNDDEFAPETCRKCGAEISPECDAEERHHPDCSRPEYLYDQEYILQAGQRYGSPLRGCISLRPDYAGQPYVDYMRSRQTYELIQGWHEVRVDANQTFRVKSVHSRLLLMKVDCQDAE